MIDHPNLLKLHEVYEDLDQDEILIVTDLYLGGSLESRIAKYKRFSLFDCLEITRHILNGMVYLHSKKIIHRDIKPANIVFKDSDGSYDLAIIDFGLATEQRKKNDLFKTCGTRGFMAPEILEKKDYDTKSDIFGVGVTFYMM